MPRPKKLKNLTIISVAISKDHLNRIREACISMSKTEGRLISVSEASRMALEALYPYEEKDEYLETID